MEYFLPYQLKTDRTVTIAATMECKLVKEESQEMREARSSRGKGGKINGLRVLVGLEAMESGFQRE